MSDNYAVVGTDVRITVILGVNITGATSKQVGYIKPSGTIIAYLTATVVDPLTGEMYGDLTHTLNDTPGLWKVFPWVVQSDGKVVSSVAKSFNVLPIGSPVPA
jgi:cation transporter-like permease